GTTRAVYARVAAVAASAPAAATNAPSRSIADSLSTANESHRLVLTSAGTSVANACSADYARVLTALARQRRVGHACISIADSAGAASGCRAARCRVSPAMPPSFKNTNAFVRSNHLSVTTYAPRANRNERPDVVIE